MRYNIFIKEGVIILKSIDNTKPQTIRDISRTSGFCRNDVIKVLDICKKNNLIMIDEGYNKKVTLTYGGKKMLWHISEMERLTGEVG